MGRAAWLKPRRLRVRLRPWARPGRQTADHLGLEPGMLWVQVPPGPLDTALSSWSSLECSPACHAGDRGFKSRRGRYWRIAARYANRQSGQAQTLVICGFDSRLRHLRPCVGWASACPTACKAASSKGYAGSTPARRTDNTARSSIGIGYQTLDLARRVRFPHGLLQDQVVQLEDTRRSERRARKGLGVQISPWSLLGLQARQVPNWLRAPSEGWSGRCARFDTGACNLETCCGWASAQPGLISLDSRVRPPDPPLDDRVRKLA